MFSKNFIEFIENNKEFKCWSKENLLDLQAGKRNLTQKHCEFILRVLTSDGKVTDLIQELFNYMKLKNLNIQVSINSRNKNNENALMLAAKHNHAEVFVLLVKNGGNVHLPDNLGNNIFDIMNHRQDDSVLKAFLEHFPKYPYFDELNQSAVDKALDKKEYSLARRLIKSNMPLNTYYPIAEQYLSTISPNCLPKQRMTPLIYAILNKKYSRAIEMLNLDADPNMGTDSGVTPLEQWYSFFKEFLLNSWWGYNFQSQYNNLMQLFKTLLEKGADPLHSSQKKRSILFDFIGEVTAFMAEHPSQPLYFIDFKGLYELMKSMIRNVKDIERVDECEQLNILSFASLCGCSAIAKFVNESRQANPASVMLSPYLFESEIAGERTKLNDKDIKYLEDRLKRQQDRGYRYQDALHPWHLYQALSTTAEDNHKNLVFMLPLAKDKLKEIMKKENTPAIPVVLHNIIAEYAAGEHPRKFNFKRLRMSFQLPVD